VVVLVALGDVVVGVDLGGAAAARVGEGADGRRRGREGKVDGAADRNDDAAAAGGGRQVVGGDAGRHRAAGATRRGGRPPAVSDVVVGQVVQHQRLAGRKGSRGVAAVGHV